jgi:hypothetical protein
MRIFFAGDAFDDTDKGLSISPPAIAAPVVAMKLLRDRMLFFGVIAGIIW